MGERLGPYLLEKRIGAGGMADVFLARGPSGICVVKKPHAHLFTNPDFVRMFLDEAALLAQLHHPGIAQIYDLGQANGAYYLAMEYVPGFDLMTISLEHERQGELMAPELCARIVADAAAALHYAHDAVSPSGRPLNIIHRDVTPHNILLSMTGVVKLIDFGVARASTAMHRTQAGLVKGKYPYMSPEQITGQDIDRRVDVYALGLVLYEMLTNVRAIPGETEVDQIDNARFARIRPIEQLRPNVPQPIRDVLVRCLHPLVEGRYQTAQQVQQDLETFLVAERHVVGQEDLLRLFRVVAAEVSHLEHPTEPSSEHAKPTQLESPKPADDAESGFASTEPSMPSPRVLVTPIKLLSPANTEPVMSPVQDPLKPLQLKVRAAELPAEVPPPAPPNVARLIAGTIAATLVIGGTAFWAFAPPKAVAPGAFDAGGDIAATTPPVMPIAAAPPDEPHEPLDAGDALVEAVAPIEQLEPTQPSRVAGRLRTQVTITSEVAGAVAVDGVRVKGGSARLTPGKHVVTLENPALNLKYLQMVEVGNEPTTVVLAPKRGIVQFDVKPFGRIALGKQVIAPGVSYKEYELWEGSYVFDISLNDTSPKKRVPVILRGGETTRVSVEVSDEAQNP